METGLKKILKKRTILTRNKTTMTKKYFIETGDVDPDASSRAQN